MLFIGLISNGFLHAQEVRFPVYRGWVNDYARVLSYEVEDRISALASEVKSKPALRWHWSPFRNWKE